MYDSILVPTDGSDVATVAVDAAVALADRFDAHVHVLHVLEVGELPPDVEDPGASELARRGREAAESAADRATEAGLSSTMAVTENGKSIHESILGYAAEHDVDCVVMGTHGRTGVGRFVLGSVAERTVRESPVPVWTVHPDADVSMAFESILVPTDGSDCAEDAAAHAIELASATDAALHVVHAVDLGLTLDVGYAGTVLDELEAAGQRAVDSVVADAEAADLSTIRASVLEGSAARAIGDYADETDVDCIVLGTHGRTGLDRYLLGSVAERVIRRSRVPVLTVGPPPAED